MDTKAEAKREYTMQLQNILTPHIYSNMQTIYNEACKIAQKDNELKEFQVFLHRIQQWPTNKIANIVKSIQDSLGGEIDLNELVKAIVKANISVYTHNHKKGLLTYDIELCNFIKAIYIECANCFYDYPYVFYSKLSQYDIKRNQREAMNMIRESIDNAIRKMLPLNFLLKEYLTATETPSIAKPDVNITKVDAGVITDRDRLRQMLATESVRDGRTYSLSAKKKSIKQESVQQDHVSDVAKCDEPNISEALKKKCEEARNDMPEQFNNVQEIVNQGIGVLESESYIPASRAQRSIVEAYTTGRNSAKPEPRMIAANMLKNELSENNRDTEIIQDHSTNHITGSYKAPSLTFNNEVPQKIVTNEINI